MLLSVVLISLVVFNSFRSCQATCTMNEQFQFVASLPDGLQCGLGIQQANATLSGEVAGMRALDTICTDACAGAVSRWLSDPTGCNDSVSGGGLAIWCQPADNGNISRCRYAFDRINPTIFNNPNILACINDTVTNNCSAKCLAGLTAMASEIGCCFQLIYNNTMVLDGLQMAMIFPPESSILFSALRSSALWDTCNVAIPAACTSPTFRMVQGQSTATTDGTPFLCFSSVVLMLSVLLQLMLF